MSVKRFDRGELQKPTRLANGWVKCDAFIGRSGILEYVNADGSVRREYRSPAEAFKASSLETFALVPLTSGHPPGGMLDASNTKEFQVGTVNAPHQDGQRVRAQILITDADAIAAASDGKAELSMGYCCDCVEEPGEFEGVRYDARQENVTGNHVALVHAGRAGSEIRLRMDTKDSEVVPSSKQPIHDDSARRNTPVKKIHIDGVEIEVPEMAAALYEKEQKAIATKMASHLAAEKTAVDALAKAQARADSLDLDLKKVKAELADAPVKAREAMAARMALETTAAKVVGDQKFDGKTDLEVKRAVIAAVTPDLKLDGKSDAYVEAAFDLALTKAEDEEISPISKARADTREFVADDEDDGKDRHTLMLEMKERERNAYKNPPKQ